MYDKINSAVNWLLTYIPRYLDIKNTPGADKYIKKRFNYFLIVI